MKAQNRIGVYGGGFDPVHNAHLTLAKTALDTLGLERVLFVPSAGQAHYKSESNVASGEHRLAMLELAFGEDERLQASDFEIRQGRFCYTINTLRAFREDEPDAELILLIGGDWKEKLYTWKEGDRIPREFSVALFSRPGSDVKTDLDPGDSEETIYSVEMPLLDISSSDIRRRIREGLPFEDKVPPAVSDYIKTHNLYR